QALPTAAAAFTLLATSTAPAALTQPAPWVRWESPAERGSPVAGSVRESGRAAYITIPLARAGPRFGLTCPLTTTPPAPARHAVPALVAGGADHDDAGLDGLADLDAERISGIALLRIAPQREVDHPDPQGIAVPDAPIQATDHRAHAAAAGLIEDLDGHQVRIGGHSGKESGGVVPTAQDNPGDMRAVPVVVVGGRLVVHQILPAHDPAGGG